MQHLLLVTFEFCRFFIILSLVTFIARTKAFEVSGLFNVGEFGVLGVIYRFNVKDLQCSVDFYWPRPFYCKDNEIVTSIKGTPVAGNTNGMVKGLGIYSQSINFMPRGFGNFFPNLLGLELANSNLKVIRRQDLSSFKLLQVIVMHGNRLESLELDTFAENPDIAFIYLPNNDFKQLDPKTFDVIPKLYHLDLTSNRCINKAATNLQQVAELKKEIGSKCKTTQNRITEAVADQDERLKTENAKLKAEIEALKGIVMQFIANDTKEYCQTHLRILGKCLSAASFQ